MNQITSSSGALVSGILVRYRRLSLYPLTVFPLRVPIYEMRMLRFIWWVTVFLVAYAGFLILFQYGPSEFVKGARKEAAQFQQLLGLQ